jgi:ADP-ribose pyrophosphatase
MNTGTYAGDGFTDEDIEVLDRKFLHRGFVAIEELHLKHRLFDGGWSPPLRRELAIRSRAVGVLLFDPVEDKVVLVKQFRTGMLDQAQSPWILEVVAGMAAEHETPADVVRREAMEETGCTIEALIPICEYFNSPGWSNEKITLFCGKVDSAGAGGIHGLDEEHEDILVLAMPIRAALAALADGKINNAMTVIALQWLAMNREFLAGQWNNSG